MHLPDHVVVQHLADFFGSRDAVARLDQRGLIFLTDDVHAKFDAFIADEYGRAGDQLADFVLALAAERAIERIFGITAANLAHSTLRLRRTPKVAPDSMQNLLPDRISARPFTAPRTPSPSPPPA